MSKHSIIIGVILFTFLSFPSLVFSEWPSSSAVYTWETGFGDENGSVVILQDAYKIDTSGNNDLDDVYKSAYQRFFFTHSAGYSAPRDWINAPEIGLQETALSDLPNEGDDKYSSGTKLRDTLDWKINYMHDFGYKFHGWWNRELLQYVPYGSGSAYRRVKGDEALIAQSEVRRFKVIIELAVGNGPETKVAIGGGSFEADATFKFGDNNDSDTHFVTLEKDYNHLKFAISRTGAPKYSYAYHYLDPTDIANYSYIRIKRFQMWYKFRGGNNKVLIRDYTPRYDDEYLMSGSNSIESDPGQLKNILLATNVYDSEEDLEPINAALSTAIGSYFNTYIKRRGGPSKLMITVNYPKAMIFKKFRNCYAVNFGRITAPESIEIQFFRYIQHNNANRQYYYSGGELERKTITVNSADLLVIFKKYKRLDDAPLVKDIINWTNWDGDGKGLYQSWVNDKVVTTEGTADGFIAGGVPGFLNGFPGGPIEKQKNFFLLDFHYKYQLVLKNWGGQDLYAPSIRFANPSNGITNHTSFKFIFGKRRYFENRLEALARGDGYDMEAERFTISD